MKKFVSLFLVLMLLAGSCVLASAEGEKTTLTIMYAVDNGELYAEDWIKHAYENWDKKDQVELELLPQVSSHTEMFTKADLMMQSEDTAPDIYLDDSFQAVSDSAAGYLMDWTDVLDSWKTWNDGSFFEAVKPMLRGENGGIYGIPYSTDTRGIWANTEILAKAGIADDWQPETWDDLLEALRQIKANVPDVIPFWYRPIANTEGTVVNTTLMFLMGTEDGLYDWNEGKWNVTSQGLLDTFTFLSTTIKEGLTGTPSEMVSTNSDSYGFQHMSEGVLAMQLGGNYIANGQFAEGSSFEWEGYENKLRYIKMPTQYGEKGGFVTMSGGWGLTIPEKSDAKELAIEFCEVMMDDVDALCKMLVNNGSLTCRDLSGAVNYSDYANIPFNEEASAFMEWTQYRPQISSYSQVSSLLAATVETVVTGTDPEKAMNNFARDVENALGADKVQYKLK